MTGTGLNSSSVLFQVQHLANDSTTLLQWHPGIFCIYIPLLQCEVEKSGLRHPSYCTFPLLCWAARWVWIRTKGRRGQSAYCAIATILTVAHCRVASLLKRKQANVVIKFMFWPPLFLFLFVFKEVYILLSWKPGSFVLKSSSFNSSILVPPSNSYSWYQLLRSKLNDLNSRWFHITNCTANCFLFFWETSKPVAGLRFSILKRKERANRPEEQIIYYNQLTVLPDNVPATKKQIGLFILCGWLYMYCDKSIWCCLNQLEEWCGVALHWTQLKAKPRGEGKALVPIVTCEPLRRYTPPKAEL